MSGADQRRGGWMQTFTGRMFWPLDPRPDEVEIADIAHSLSLLCRYGGHVPKFYSVAQHCVLVSMNVEEPYALDGLLHDAAEAYVQDVVRPLKHFLTGYKEAEQRVLTAIMRKLHPWASYSNGGLYVEPPEVIRADNVLLACEMRDLMATPPAMWDLPEAALKTIHVEPWASEVAERWFLSRYQKLVFTGGYE